MTERLSCCGLTGGRGSVTAFRGVDLDVEAGRIVALLGPNGAGKTTLLLTLAGLLPAQGGSVSVDGSALAGGRPTRANRAGVVLVPDDRSLFTTLTVEENLQVAARKGGPKPRDMLDVFPGLEKRWKVRAGSLSGGEQQMLAMGRALVQQPKVLLIDEMSMGLAPVILESLFLAVRTIADEHACAVLLVEQHVHLALGVADEAAVLNHGEILLRRDARTLQEQPELIEQVYFGTPEASSAAG